MKLIISDLDGTLVHKQQITENTLATIQKLHQHGFAFTIATGRHVSATKEIAQKLNIKLPVICSNGAYIYDFENEEIIDQVLIDPQTSKDIIKDLNDDKYEYLLYTPHSIIGSDQSKSLLISKIGQAPILVVPKEYLEQYLTLGLVKILVIDQDFDRISKLKNKLKSYEQVYAIQSQSDFLDIGNIKANKGNALEKLSKYLNIALDECLSIGDQENDLEMILNAKIGVAMGNGVQILKEASDFVTKTYDQDGFSYAIEQLLFKKIHNKTIK
jgi:Cof subfamily protein (haloacid dehalogenase superfamily)